MVYTSLHISCWPMVIVPDGHSGEPHPREPERGTATPGWGPGTRRASHGSSLTTQAPPSISSGRTDSVRDASAANRSKGEEETAGKTAPGAALVENENSARDPGQDFLELEMHQGWLFIRHSGDHHALPVHLHHGRRGHDDAVAGRFSDCEIRRPDTCAIGI